MVTGSIVPQRLKNLLPIVAALPAALSVFVLMASGRFPLDGDAISFVPAAESYAKGWGLVNRLYDVTFAYSPANDGRFIWHGFLTPMVLGALAFPADYQGVCHAMAFVALAALLLWAIAAARLLLQAEAPLWQRFLFVFSGSAAVGGFVFNNGRPEPLATLWVSAGCVVIAYTKQGPIRDCLIGCALGLIALTSPASGVFCALGYGIFAALTIPPARWISAAFTTGLVGMAAMVACFAVYPYGINEWIGGLRSHAAAVVLEYTGSRYIYYWFVAFPMLGGIATLCLLASLHYIIKDRGSLSRFVALTFLLLALFFCWRIAPDGRNYNVVALMAAGILALFCALAARNAFALRPKIAVACSVAAAVTVSLGGTELLRAVAISAISHAHVTRMELQARISQIPDSGDVTVTAGLFTALPSNSLAKTVINTRIMEKEPVPVETEWLFVQQINPARRVPPELDGYELVENRFTTEKPSLFGVSIAQTPRGYHYALYRRSH